MKHVDIKRLFANWGGISLSVICAAFGLSLLAAPDISSRIIAYALAAVFVGIGIIHIVSYFVRDPYLGMTRQQFMTGLTSLSVGILIIARPHILSAILPAIWGCILIVGGFAKLQAALDFSRMKKNRWYLSLIAAVVSLVLGAVILSDPFGAAMVLTRFIGASLLVEGAVDCTMSIVMSRTIKSFYPGH